MLKIVCYLVKVKELNNIIYKNVAKYLCRTSVH